MWGCILYIGLQIFTLWQKSKVGVRIVFDGVLYLKFYGNDILQYSLVAAIWNWQPYSVKQFEHT